MKIPAEEAVKLSSNAIKDIGKNNGPWAVLFLLSSIIFLIYIMYEKHECTTETQCLRTEVNALKKENATLQITLANCETMMKYFESYTHPPQTKSRR